MGYITQGWERERQRDREREREKERKREREKIINREENRNVSIWGCILVLGLR